MRVLGQDQRIEPSLRRRLGDLEKRPRDIRPEEQETEAGLPLGRAHADHSSRLRCTAVKYAANGPPTVLHCQPDSVCSAVDMESEVSNTRETFVAQI
jgi:hypothetical protein